MPMLHASPTGIVALVAVVMSWSFAVVLFRAGPRGNVARRLAMLLVVEGLALATSGSIDLLAAGIGDIYQRHPALPFAEVLLHALADCGMLVLYPPFLAAALRTPLTRPFAATAARAVVAVAATLLYAALVAPFVAAFAHSTAPDYGRAAIPAAILYVALVALFVDAFVASVHAWHASSGLARKRARIFAVAFGLRDICWGIV